VVLDIHHILPEVGLQSWVKMKKLVFAAPKLKLQRLREGGMTEAIFYGFTIISMMVRV
jgi:hypothetical protein